MLQLNSHYILNGFKMYAKDLKIQSIAFRLKGSGAKLYNLNYDSVYQKEQKKNSEKIAETEKILSKDIDFDQAVITYGWNPYYFKAQVK